MLVVQRTSQANQGAESRIGMGIGGPPVVAGPSRKEERSAGLVPAPWIGSCLYAL